MSSENWADIISAYIQQRLSLKLESVQKARDTALKGSHDDNDIAVIEAEYANTVLAFKAKFSVNAWLDSAAERAAQISLATHAAKFTHSDAQSSSMLCLQYDANAPYFSTASISRPDVDIVGSAGALDVAGLLMLTCNGAVLYQSVEQKDPSPFSSFTDNVDKIQCWIKGLSAALLDPKLSSCSLSKQVYFPLPDGDYHMLSPLFATSLAQRFNDAVAHARYSEEAQNIRAARRAGEYHEKKDVMFLNTAVQNFGGANKQNISLLNVKRRGETVLLTCAPPAWQAVNEPPINESSIFLSREFVYRSRAEVKALQRFLLSIRHRDSTYEIRQTVAEHINTLTDILFDYAVQVQSLTGFAGWSQQDCRLARSQALWLDTWCEDHDFQYERAKQDWLQEISFEFAEWLNQRLNAALKHEGLIFDVVQRNHWEKLFLPRLREFEHGTEVYGLKNTEAAK